MHISHRKRLELIFLAIYYVLIAVLIVSLKIGYLGSILLYAGLPSLYLTVKRPEIFKKTTIYSLVFSFTSILIIDYIATNSGVWQEVSSLGVYVFGLFPIDAFVWGFLYSYFIISYYEYFFDGDRKKKRFSHNTRYVFYLSALLISIFAILLISRPDLLIIKYFYLLVVIITFILPMCIFFFKHPEMFEKILIAGLYAFVLSLIYELSALYVGQWNFGTDYIIGYVNFLGLTFPIEELMWLALAVPAFICNYEYFADDEK